MTKKLMLGFAVAAVAISASAKTTTWTAGTTYKTDKVAKRFSDPNNWNNGAPEPGDTVVIEGTSGWDNPIYIGIENGATDTIETFDFGDKGLTLEIKTSYTRFLVDFQGTGRVVKTGGGKLGLACDSSFTGGCEMQAGLIEAWDNGNVFRFGTEPIEFVNSASAHPGVTSDSWGASLKNAMLFSGLDEDYTVSSLGQAYTYGLVTATHDCSFKQTYGVLTFGSPVSATGKTLTIAIGRQKDANSAPGVKLSSSVDASLVFNPIEGSLYVTPIVFEGVSTNPDNGLTVGVSDCQFSASARWGGTNIVLRSNAEKLTLKSSSNLSADAYVSIENDAKISVAQGVTVGIRGLTVKGTPVPSGYYTKVELPLVIDGDGCVAVGMGKRTTWLGGLTGGSITSPNGGTPLSIFDPANWDNGVPVKGDILVFTNTYHWSKTAYVGLEGETFDIGSEGIVIETVSHIKLNTKLTGSGTVVKTGSGTLGVAVNSEHAGGARITEGKFESFISSLVFGTGPVTLVNSGSKKPAIEANLWGCGIKNKLVFEGDVSSTVTSLGQYFTFGGDIESCHDFTIEGTYGSLTFSGTISAPGRTFTANANRTVDENNPPHFYCQKSVDANLLKLGNRTLYLQGVSTNSESGLTVREGSCVIDTNGSWAGTNVVVEATAGALTLKANANLSDAATVRIDTSNGAKINIASGVKVAVAELHVDGVQKPAGLYSAANLPNVITGAGKLRVGTPGVVVIFR